MKTIFKKAAYSVLPFFYLLNVASAQTGSVIRPEKEKIYYTSSTSDTWELSNIRTYTYNQHGDIVTRINFDKDSTVISKDSMVYNTAFNLLERHSYIWDRNNKKYLHKDKIINCYDSKGRGCGSLVYRWENVWKLVSGSETLHSFDASKKEEISTTRIYHSEDEKWYNLVKEVHQFNNLGQTLSKTIYSANPTSSEFELFSRHTYNGWHNYEKGIYKELTNEKYLNNTWVVESRTSIKKQNDLWLEEEERVIEGSKYRILFAEDNTFREVMKENVAGWLAISVYQKDGNIEKITENEFSSDILLKVRKKENEINPSGRPVRVLVEETDADGKSLDFSEVLHELKYDSENNLLEDIAKVSTTKGNQHKPAIRIVYSNYKDVSVVLGNEDDIKNEKIILYPNPGNGIFNVNCIIKGEVKVYSTTGNLIMEENIKGSQLDLSRLKSGIYFLHIQHGNRYLSKKVTIE